MKKKSSTALKLWQKDNLKKKPDWNKTAWHRFVLSEQVINMFG